MAQDPEYAGADGVLDPSAWSERLNKTRIDGLGAAWPDAARHNAKKEDGPNPRIIERLIGTQIEYSLH
jgi:hypothetical protein